MIRMPQNYAILMVFLSVLTPSQVLAECTPKIHTLAERIELHIGASDLKFELLVAGCESSLSPAWPPENLTQLEEALARIWEDRHPLVVLLELRKRSPEILREAKNAINGILGAELVSDIFVYSGRVAE